MKQDTVRKVLVVDDEAVVRTGVSRIVNHLGIGVDEADDGKKALAMLQENSYDVVFLDIRMHEMGGLEVLGWINKHAPGTTAVMITGISEPDMVIQSMKMGAFDYLVKPFGMEDIEHILERAAKDMEPMAARRAADDFLQAGPDRVIIGTSAPMKKLYSQIFKVAPTDSTVLITGESGTGKELVARAIHYHSKRNEREFVPVDCSALVENLLESELFGHVKGSFTGAMSNKKGLFELANHGTFFFDEISNLSMDMQAKLLRVIQEREFSQVGGSSRIKVDIRIMVASNRDLKTAIAQNRFREDLFYRLHVIPIHLPPLRERKGDLPALVSYFIRKNARKIGRDEPEISREAMEMLEAYPWPGNVRELENTIERIMILEEGDVILPEHLPPDTRQKTQEFAPFSDKLVCLKELEREYIRHVLEKTGGGIQKTASILGINRKTLSMKMKKYGL
ncbi:MAG: sigma-54-dependent Fis family transcriptional regulator [Deltaproteobacteria bacterium]|nr:sigma-54-dependent Fis family transcriptional regulator [Deltaproteobacteria bacterium]